MMASFNALFPVFAPIATEFVDDEHPTTYGAGAVVGKLMSVSVSPNFTQAGRLGKYALVFDNASIALNTTALPADASAAMFGDFAALEQGVPGGFGYAEGVMDSGAVTYAVHWLRKVVFTPPPESAVSINGTTVSFSTPSIVGVAWDDGSEQWRDDPATFATAAAAIDYLKTKAGID